MDSFITIAVKAASILNNWITISIVLIIASSLVWKIYIEWKEKAIKYYFPSETADSKEKLEADQLESIRGSRLSHAHPLMPKSSKE